MSKEIYENRQIPVGTSSKKGSRTWGLIGVVAILLSIIISYHFGYKKQEEKKAVAEAAYEAAVSKAPAEIESSFKNWNAITAEKEVAVKWSGAESEILYLRFVPAGQGMRTRVDERWEIWARTKAGKIFIVDYWLDKNLKVVGSQSFRQSSTEALLNTLLYDKKTDLIEKLKFQTKPA